MEKFIDAIITHGRAVLLTLLLILITGTYAYTIIPKEKEPDVQIPVIYISMHHEGISPEDGERLLIRPIEKSLRSIEGIKEIRSVSTEGHASVIMEFHAGFDSERALTDVREKVDETRPDLPTDTDEPTVHEINLSQFPVLNIILSSDIPEHSLVRIARKLRDKIEELPNILEVKIAGDREDIVELIVPPETIQSYTLNIEDIFASFNRNNLLIAAGSIDNPKGKYTVKSPGLLEGPQDINTVPVITNGERIVTADQLATTRKTFRDPENIARANGKPTIVLEVSKRTGSNIIETNTLVRHIVDTAIKQHEFPINVIYAQDKSSSIIGMLNDLQNNIILAIALVTTVMVWSIGKRSATLVAIAIPGAFLTGILIIYLLGHSLNIVVLFSLILSIGMLVDSAIVITEYADRKMIDGVPYTEAYSMSAKHMAWPIIASTITTLIVFMPLLSWPGIVGQFMKFMPITLIATLSGSLLMALIFVPTLGSWFGKQLNVNQELINNIQATEDGRLEDIKGYSKKYANLVTKVLNKPYLFASTIVGILFIVMFLYGLLGRGVEFFPNIEPENTQLLVHARGNLSTEEKSAIAKQVEDRILIMKDEVHVFYTKAGNVSSDGQSLPEDVIAIIQMEYKPWKYRRPANEINAEILERTQNIPGIYVEISEEKPGPSQGKPIHIEVSSENPDAINPVVEKIINHMQQMAGLKNIEDDRPVPAIEWEIKVNREKAARFNADVATAGNYLKLVTNGLKVNTYRPDYTDEEVDIIARFPKENRNLSELDRLNIITSNGPIPISNFVTRNAKQNVASVRRTDGYRTITIKADVTEGVLPDQKISEINSWIQNANLDSNVQITFKGEKEDQQETSNFLRNAFLLALSFMALVLVIQFNSFYHSFIIMSAIFLSTIGVLLGLLITQQPFGIVMCGVGIIALSGIVVNNNIIFIDTFRILKNRGINTKEAIIRTGIQRLRPILLTAGTTILGLIPMVIGMNIDFLALEVTFGAPSSQWWKQLSTTIAGGLAFATILTLFLTPALLLIGERFHKPKTSHV